MLFILPGLARIPASPVHPAALVHRYTRPHRQRPLPATETAYPQCPQVFHRRRFTGLPRLRPVPFGPSARQWKTSTPLR